MKIKKIPSLYSQEQLYEYLERIGWSGEAPQPNVECLKHLMQRHLQTIPFSNTFIAYEKEPAGIDPQDVFERLVRKKGSIFCFGQNLLFREILRVIGYRCYSTAARVNGNHASDKEIQLGGLSHMVTFVSFEEDPDVPDEEHLWLVDVGFGGANIIQPLPLHGGAEVTGALNEHHRIAEIEHPKSSLDASTTSAESHQLPLGIELALQWQARNANGQPEHPWRTCYVFSLTEMHPEDYSLLHYSVCHRGGLFVTNLLACRVLPPLEPGQPFGRLTIFNESMQKKHTGRETERTVFKSEKQRIEAIENLFGIGNLPVDAEENAKSNGIAVADKH